MRYGCLVTVAVFAGELEEKRKALEKQLAGGRQQMRKASRMAVALRTAVALSEQVRGGMVWGLHCTCVLLF